MALPDYIRLPPEDGMVPDSVALENVMADWRSLDATFTTALGSASPEDQGFFNVSRPGNFANPTPIHVESVLQAGVLVVQGACKVALEL